MILLAAGNKQLLETIFQSVFLSGHRRSSVGKYCGKYFYSKFICEFVSSAPRSLLPFRFTASCMILVQRATTFCYVTPCSSSGFSVISWRPAWFTQTWGHERGDRYKNKEQNRLVCPEPVETDATQINGQTDRRVAAQEKCGLFLYLHLFIGFDCNTIYIKKALRCVFQTLHLPRLDVAAWDTNLVFIFGRTIPLNQLFVHAAVIMSPDCTFGI